MLDGFVFDIDELREYAEHDLYQFFKNPHLINRSQGQEFTPYAKYKLKAHPVLMVYAKSLAERLSSQTRNIQPQTVDAVIKMLQRFEEKGVEGSVGARAEFLEHKFSLSTEAQAQLDSFIIEIPTFYGTKERFTFEKAFLGGDLVNQCIIAAQIYLWQFVVTLRPSAMSLVPSSVIQSANKRFFCIGPSEDQSTHYSQREREVKTQHQSSIFDDPALRTNVALRALYDLLGMVERQIREDILSEWFPNQPLDASRNENRSAMNVGVTTGPELKAGQSHSRRGLETKAQATLSALPLHLDILINNPNTIIFFSPRRAMDRTSRLFSRVDHLFQHQNSPTLNVGAQRGPEAAHPQQEFKIPAASNVGMFGSQSLQNNNIASNMEAAPLTMNRAGTLFRQLAENVGSRFGLQNSTRDENKDQGPSKRPRLN